MHHHPLFAAFAHQPVAAAPGIDSITVAARCRASEQPMSKVSLHHHPHQQLTRDQRSKSIPIHGSSSAMKRTLSEQQLYDDEELADFRDFLMFSRIAEGIARQQRRAQHYPSRVTNDRCLKNIIGTRNLTQDELLRQQQQKDFEQQYVSERSPNLFRLSSISAHHHHPTRSTRVNTIPGETISVFEPKSRQWILSNSFQQEDVDSSPKPDDDVFYFEL